MPSAMPRCLQQAVRLHPHEATGFSGTHVSAKSQNSKKIFGVLLLVLRVLVNPLVLASLAGIVFNVVAGCASMRTGMDPRAPQLL